MKWLITFTKVLRGRLPAGQYTISHAPVAPWFSNEYAQSGYLEVNRQVGSLIDWCVFFSIVPVSTRSNMFLIGTTFNSTIRQAHHYPLLLFSAIFLRVLIHDLSL